MSKIHGEFSLHFYRNNEGQLPVVKLVVIGNSYLIQTLDKHSGLLFLHKRIIYFSFSVQMKGSYGRLSLFQDCYFYGYRWEETDSYCKIWFYNCWQGNTHNYFLHLLVTLNRNTKRCEIWGLSQYNEIAIKLVQKHLSEDIMARIIKEKNKLKTQNAKNHHLLRWWEYHAQSC